MNDEVITNIINVIKTSTDKQVIYRALVKIRTDLVKDREGIAKFRKCGGIPATVPFLHKTHEKILEIALSILANCCTEPESCIQAAECKIVPPVLAIMKNIASSIIQCRACRLLGNLIREKEVDVSKHSKPTAQALCLILEESFESATTMMAARAARFAMIENASFLREFVGSNGVQILMNILTKHLKNNVESVNTEEKKDDPISPGLKSIQHRDKYFQEVVRSLECVRSDIFDYETLKEKKKPTNNFLMPEDKAVVDMLGEVVKCLQILSDPQNSVPYYAFSGNGLGMPAIVFFVDEKNSFRQPALKILSNFSKNSMTAHIINEADAISAACDLITSKELERPLNEAEERYCYNVICLLSGESCNRAKIRRGGALFKLLQKAQNCTSRSEISGILYALNNFQYDQMSMNLLLSNGLVEILIRELEAYLNSEECLKTKNEKKKLEANKRKLEGSPLKISKSLKLSPESFFELDSPVSPLSLNRISLASPCSSRSISPVSNSSRFEEDHDFGSETYSPVCSDNEDDDDSNENENQTEENPVMQLLAVCGTTENNIDESISDKEEDDDPSQEIGNTKSVHKKTISIIENLLFRASLSLKHKNDFGKRETILTIIEAIKVFGTSSSNFINTLCNVFSESQFFVPLIKQDILYPIYQLTRMEGLEKIGHTFIGQFAGLGESGYGRGELGRMLSRGDFKLQKQASIATGFIVKSKKVLYPLLTECGALYTLISCILDKNEVYRYEAAASITFLSSQALDMNIPTCDLTQFNCEREFDEELDCPKCEEDNEDTMKFVLELGCSNVGIKFDKKLLTKNSEVFDSMLNSDFREGNEKEVRLKNVSVNGIKYFLNLINLESQGENLNIPPVYHFNSILEAYELARMYILSNIEEKLLTLIIHRLSETSVLKLFEWALDNFHPKLLEISINYFLCSDVDPAKKVDLFREADYCKYTKEWNHMIVEAVLDHCKRGCEW